MDDNAIDIDIVWDDVDGYDGDIGSGKLSMTIMMTLFKTLMQSMT